MAILFFVKRELRLPLTSPPPFTTLTSGNAWKVVKSLFSLLQYQHIAKRLLL